MLEGIFEVAWNYIQMIKITDILDIALIAFLIYKVIIFTVRTNSARSIIKGILLIIVVMWMSSLLNLNVINFLLGKTMELGILAIIILFQPELRRILERVGSGKMLNVFGRQLKESRLETAIEQTVLACADMSKSRIGALIVFEREIKVDDPIKTGTIINADTTAELLKNIFYPKAPLHDGAVIIRNDQIAAAGCMLPLSTNPNLSRDLGMRHRAGIGMSEVSDAVVVIVSEETGSIAVAVDGMLKRHLALDTFERLLRNELMPDEEPKVKTVDRFKNTLKVKRNAAGKNK
ncbi:MAG TPA: TIGR00159 family protein [Clostridiales bacterium]|jgi:diadenylate cyclase|nr:TIGR00159 family protein [Clostridiales bacterium]